ncbi:hypothetical protein [Escherichia coli]|nr:hypothetical protein [Escherichia coli]
MATHDEAAAEEPEANKPTYRILARPVQHGEPEARQFWCDT